jgi:hypothetical protein
MADDEKLLMLADLQEVTCCIQYALGWDASGKPRGVKLRANDHLTAQWLVEHLIRSRFVVMRRPPLRNHA